MLDGPIEDGTTQESNETTLGNEAPRTLNEVAFRSILDRDSEDQAEAIRRGYSSVEQLAIDELGQAFHQLRDDIAWLKRAHNEVVDAIGEHTKSLEAIDHEHAQRVVDTVRDEAAKATEAIQAERDVHVQKVEGLEGRIEAMEAQLSGFIERAEAKLATIQPAEGT